MLVLHASLGPDDHVFVWAELSSPQSFATAEDLARAFGDVGGRPTTVAVALPTVEGRAVASPELARVTGAASAPPAGSILVLDRHPVAAVDLAAGELVDAIAQLADADDVILGGDLRALLELARHAASAVVRQEYLPDARFERPPGGGAATLHARWSPLPGSTSSEALEAVIDALPAAVGALSSGRELEEPLRIRARRFVASVVDDLVRRRIASDPPRLVAATPSRAESMHDRWMRALVIEQSQVDGPEDALDRLAAEVADWQARLRRRTESPWRLRLRLEEPNDPASADDDAPPIWTLRYLVQLRSDPSVLIPAAGAWAPTGSDRTMLEMNGFHAGEHLLAPLAEAAQLFEPIADSLGEEQPTACELSTEQAHRFLVEVVPLLEPTGVSVAIPSWWASGRPKVSMRAQLVTELHGGRQHMDSLNLATLVGYDWRVAIGDAELTRDQLTRLAAQKSRLVHVRGRWMELDDATLRAAIRHVEAHADGPTFASIADLVRMSLGAAPDIEGVPVSGVDGPAGDDIAQLLAGVARGEPVELPDAPAGLEATLRPYQLRGYQWLVSMANLGLGACLADDMGLGKTVQVLAAIQHAWEGAAPVDRAPTLVVCPTSVLTNWRRETERFTPELPAFVHHGSARARDERFQQLAARHAIVFTSYALLARDVEQLRQVGWRMVVLDEAQNIKNPGTRHARAARAITAPARVALTGTPVENHAGDLWSIMEFLNPGLLGSQADFRRKYLIPIQTGTFPEAAARLRQVVAPFLLRREKVDPEVIADLPDKLEQVAWSHLTTEQVSLYEAIVRDAAETLRMARGQAKRSGIERRGLILATISKLKQACNHPAQLLADQSRIAGRSGKLQRLEGLLENVLDLGERALVFTQFVAMGELLQTRLREAFGREVLFLHGGTSRAERDRIVERFQDPSAEAPPILVLSLKAGGSGLNLTAATHVFHFDRWWNPATEQQATDRAFRIGQTRDVQVHAMVCSGTVEERIDLMLRQKQGVASSLIGSGEQWITELEDADVLELLTLRRDTMLQDGRLDHLDPKEWQRGSL